MSAAGSKLSSSAARKKPLVDAHAELMLFYRYSVQVTYALAAFDPTLYDAYGQRDDARAVVLSSDEHVSDTIMQRLRTGERHSARALVFVLLGCGAPYQSFSSAAQMVSAWLARRDVRTSSLLYHVCMYAVSHFPCWQPVITAQRFLEPLPAVVLPEKRFYHLNSVRVHKQELVKQMAHTPAAVLHVRPGLDQTVIRILHNLNDVHAALLQHTCTLSINALGRLYGQCNEAKLWLLDANTELTALQVQRMAPARSRR